MPNMRRANIFTDDDTQREKIINSVLNDLDYARFNHLLISSDIKLFGMFRAFVISILIADAGASVKYSNIDICKQFR